MSSRDHECPKGSLPVSDEDAKFLKETRDVFRQACFLTLADVRSRVADDRGSTKRRDTLSAFDTVAKVFEISLAQVTLSGISQEYILDGSKQSGQTQRLIFA